MIFAKPWEEDEAFPDFLDYVVKQEKGQQLDGAETRYAQTRETPRLQARRCRDCSC